MTKILFIGNSFSEDATRYIEKISCGELFVRNMYIGGCSLETHAKNAGSGEACYDYQKDAEPISRISIQDALTCEAWDCVSVQQVSSLSGIGDSYEPYITTLIGEIRRLASQAQIVFHRTWSYDEGSGHPEFYRYNNDSNFMWECIQKATAEIAKRHSLRIIPTGNAIAAARLEPELAHVGGKVSLTRDSFHLSLDYGRYLAGLVLYKFFTGKSPLEVEFAPEKCDTGVIKKIKSIVDALDFNALT